MRVPTARRWFPASLLILGCFLVFGGATSQRSMYLRAPLGEVVPRVLLDAESRDIEISEGEQRVAGMDSYVLREYNAPDAAPFSVYVGFYERQTEGHTIHSPKNCLPGGGWEPLTAGLATVPTEAGGVTVNRYLVGNGSSNMLVLYWYQGRGRVAANEYLVKWDLLRDQILHGRSDEALVRVVIPVETTEQEALDKGLLVARVIVPTVDRALPER